MKTKFSVIRIMIGVTFALLAADCGVTAQTTNNSAPVSGVSGAAQKYDIEIVDGKLLMPSTNRTGISYVPGTIGSLATYLRGRDANLNIVLSPGAADVTIPNLKLRSADMAALAEAISFATDGAVRGASFSGTSNWTFMARQPRKTERTVEVFNLSTLVRRTGSKGPEVDQPELDDIKRMIVETIGQLKQGEVNEDRPDFVFHPGANLLIVTGTPMAIEVARKVIAALPTRPRIWPPPLDNTTTPRHE